MLQFCQDKLTYRLSECKRHQVSGYQASGIRIRHRYQASGIRIRIRDTSGIRHQVSRGEKILDKRLMIKFKEVIINYSDRGA